jgi:hypothetical protein
MGTTATDHTETSVERILRVKRIAIGIIIDFGPSIKTQALVDAIERSADVSTTDARGVIWELNAAGDIVIGPYKDIISFPVGSGNATLAEQRAVERAYRRQQGRAWRAKK